ncbi:hypothetical protein EV363DRAFT_1302675 [Boletus edulis]|nr:hypothetical protein EV363DRAFT_1302675 [Boletus edulis]
MGSVSDTPLLASAPCLDVDVGLDCETMYGWSAAMLPQGYTAALSSHPFSLDSAYAASKFMAISSSLDTYIRDKYHTSPSDHRSHLPLAHQLQLSPDTVQVWSDVTTATVEQYSHTTGLGALIQDYIPGDAFDQVPTIDIQFSSDPVGCHFGHQELIFSGDLDATDVQLWESTMQAGRSKTPSGCVSQDEIQLPSEYVNVNERFKHDKVQVNVERDEEGEHGNIHGNPNGPGWADERHDEVVHVDVFHDEGC